MCGNIYVNSEAVFNFKEVIIKSGFARLTIILAAIHKNTTLLTYKKISLITWRAYANEDNFLYLRRYI